MSLEVTAFVADWPIPTASPFCLKLETWLRMAEIPYVQRTPNGPPRSRSGKVPYVRLDDGEVLDDSERIQSFLARQHGVDLDAHLSAADRHRAVLLRRTVEDHLYFATLVHRWVDPSTWTEVKRAYFGSLPFPIRVLVPLILRRSVRRDAWGQGTGRRPLDEVYAHAAEDIRAIGAFLGTQPFFFGQPSSTDAAVFGALENIRVAPLDWPAKEALLGHGPLVAWMDRMRARYWAEDWPG